MSAKIVVKNIIFVFFVFLLCGKSYGVTQYYVTDPTYVPGTKCPKAQNGNPNYAAVCGVVKSALPKEATIGDVDILTSAEPLEGVSIYLYEFAPKLDNGAYNPTGKFGGALMHPYSSTWTNEKGRFRLEMRKIGGAELRYLVFVCNGYIAALKKINSYQDLEISEFISCPKVSSYIPPPITLSYVDRINHLSCEMTEVDESGNSQVKEVSHENSLINPGPNATLNFFLDLDGADARFMVPGGDSELDRLATGIGNVKGPKKGAWWSKDCLIQYRDDPLNQSLCASWTGTSRDYEFDPFYTFNNWGTVIAEYEDDLYSESRFLVQNFLPNIPAYNTALFYKEFPARMDQTEYIQDPTKPAQFLHTHFGNCIGSVFLRKFGDMESVDDYIDCEEFRKCNRAITYNESINNYRNDHTTSGYAKLLMGPPDKLKVLETEVDPSIKVCRHRGSIVTIGQFQPDNSTCIIGGPGCEGYVLSKDYFNTEILFYYGQRGSTAKYPFGGESINDSFSAVGFNYVPFKTLAEGAGVPPRLGTYAIISNGGLNSNNSAVAAIGIASNAFSYDDEPLTNVLSAPYETYDEKSIYLTGAPIVDKDISKTLCLYSNVNPEDQNITPENEVSVFRNNIFEGNPDHHPDDPIIDISGLIEWLFPDLGRTDNNDGTRTATSAIYLTSAAKNRMRALGLPTIVFPNGVGLLNDLDLSGRDFYDGLLSASYGHGKVELKANLRNFALGIVSNFLLPRTASGKTFFDRENISFFSNPSVLEDIKVTYPVSESIFMSLFNLPYGNLFRGDWGNDGGTGCYPWNKTGFKGVCGTYKENVYRDNDSDKAWALFPNVSRTCRVDDCRTAAAIVKCTYTLGEEDSSYWVPPECGFAICDFRPNCDCPAYDTWNCCPGYWAGGTSNTRNTKCTILRKVTLKENIEEKDVDYIDLNLRTDKCPGALDETGFNIKDTKRLTCAQKQKTCFLEPTQDMDPVYGGPVGSPYWPTETADKIKGCLRDTYEGEIINAIVKLSNRSPPSVQQILNAPGHRIVHDESPVTPICDMSRAGPYECASDINKDANYKATQQFIKEPSNLYADYLAIAENEITTNFRSPTDRKQAYFVGAEISANSSVNPNDPHAFINTGKDIQGGVGGGAKSAILSLWAAPTDFTSTPRYNHVEFHCISDDLLSVGTWDCPTYPVPNPEIVDLDSLNIDGDCALVDSSACIAALNATGLGTLPPNFVFSNSFKQILGAAATKFQVPASAILVYLARIGKLYTYSSLFAEKNDELLEELSAPWYGQFKSCDKTSTDAQGPYDWILRWFDAALAIGGSDALDEISSGRGETANRCNFLDATYALSSALGNGDNWQQLCGHWDWAEIRIPIHTQVWGAAPEGTWRVDEMLDPLGVMNTVFDACKVE